MATNTDLFFVVAGLAFGRYACKRLIGYPTGAPPRPAERPVVLVGGALKTPGAVTPPSRRVRIRAEGGPVEVSDAGELDLTTPYFSAGAVTISIPDGKEIELSLESAALGGLANLVRACYVSAQVGAFSFIRVEP